jgi:hypothetical protein
MPIGSKLENREETGTMGGNDSKSTASCLPSGPDTLHDVVPHSLLLL